MREMKDSGIEWIGDVPQNWQLVRIKVCVSRRDSGAWGEEATGEPGDCVCIRVADMDYDRLRLKDDLPFTYRNYEEKVIESLKLADGDILIEKSGGGEKTLVGRAVMFRGTLQAVFANFMERIRCRDFVRSRFLLYILAVLYQSEYIKNYIKQTTGIQNLDISSMFSREYLALPPVVVQDRITDFLDRKCSQIDAIIARQQEVIEKLKAYKLSVITEAVTKGLNPNVPMKDSGVEWIGEIPEHWETASISRVATVVRGASPRPAGDSRYFNGQDVPWITVAEVTKDDGKYITSTESYLTEEGAKYSRVVEKGTLLLSNSGATLGVPKVTLITGCINDGSVAFLDLRVEQMYLLYIFKSRTLELRKQMQGYGQPNLNTTIIKSIAIPLPHAEEQKSICDYLDKRCKAVDNAIEIKEKVVDRLAEYKKSLIYEVVTGKKEV